MSSAAKAYLAKLMEEQQVKEGSFLRVGVKGGGCSGLEYQMNFDNEGKTGDEVFENEPLNIVTDKKSLLYLYGTELDYNGGLNGKGLVFNNPNASRTCSCGESFAV